MIIRTIFEEHQIWFEISPKLRRTQSLRMELLDPRGPRLAFKHVFGIGVGGEFEKFWIEINNSRTSTKIDWFLQKRECNYTC